MNTTNEQIKSAINNGEAISFGKMGNVESSHLNTFLNGNPQLINYQLFVNAGIYTPSRETLEEWCSLFLESVKNLDYILQWHEADKDLIESIFPPERIFYSFEGLEPFVLGEEGWHYSLRDKKVLCVSPFSDTVKMQVEKFGNIWEGASIGEVLTVQSPYSEALTGEEPRHWREKLDEMLDQINKLDFDFATVGCGGFSLIVCDHIKKLGKPSVHLGGGNQLLYGIRGKRWDDGFSKYEWYASPKWTRPLAHEVPPMKHFVEGGCYW